MGLHNIIFTILNGVALIGWSSILLQLLSITFKFHVESLLAVLPSSFPIVLLYILEGICLMEVGRIALGHLKGNLILGLVLHAIRLTCLAYVVLADGLQVLLSLPGPASSNFFEDLKQRRNILQTSCILYSWSITEVCRYPMYLFPSSDKARTIRLVVPIISFPIGCALEAYGAFRVVWPALFSGDGSGKLGISDIITEISWVKPVLLWMVILINGLLGPTLAYPAMFRKGLPVLMGNTESEMRERSKRE